MTRISALRLAGPALILGVALSACAPDRVVTGSTYPMDYRERHPIVLAHAPYELDVFVSPSGLDSRHREDVRGFAAEYRRKGEGYITAHLPEGPKAGVSSRRALGAVLNALAEAGVPRTRVRTVAYAADDPTIAAPVRLSFTRLQAKVGGRCGLWPQDLGVSDVKFNARNEPYWNHGCAYQSNFAAQVADPIDLVRGREEGRVDTGRRMNNIDKLRQAQDPSTEWKAEDDNVNKTFGN
jgi:pilus assembly protein CpaD